MCRTPRSSAATTRTTSSPSKTAPRPSRPPEAREPGSGCGTSAPDRWCWPPEPTTVRSCSRTTTVPAYDLVADLPAAGVTVPAVIDSRTAASARGEEVTAATGTRLILGSAVTDTAGEGPAGRVSSITVAGLDSDGVAGSVGED